MLRDETEKKNIEKKSEITWVNLIDPRPEITL